MTARAASLTWYGAYELKRDYQKHFGYGIAFSAIFALCVMGSILTYQALTAKETVAKPPIVTIYEPPKPVPPPRATERPAIPRINTEVNLPVIGIPTPVPDAEVQDDVRFPTRQELAEITPSGSEIDGIAGNAVVNTPGNDLGEYFPPPDEFVAVQEMPTLIKAFEPEYPEIAILTNREATVWVKALVDKEGRVREARIAKSSDTNVGFDEAALAAAYKNIYKPAIQNGRPVAIWVTYPVEFKMK